MAQGRRNAKNGSKAQAFRRGELIDATLTVIANDGLPHLTLAKVAALAGLTAGSVNFHFSTKEALLLEALRQVAEEFESEMDAVLARTADDAGDALLGIIDKSFDPQLSEPRKAAVWYGFLAEAGSRSDYLAICDERDVKYHKAVHGLFNDVIKAASREDELDVEALTCGFLGLIDGLWQEILFTGDAFDRDSAKRRCRSYLASVMPWRFKRPAPRRSDSHVVAAPTDDTGLTYTLPSWIYNNDEYFELEKEHVIMPAWHVVCHETDVSEIGDYSTFDLLGERAFVIRGKDCELRAFYNVCSHRAHAVVTGASGNCKSSIQCPYHGWNYYLDGSLKAAAAADGFSGKIPKDRFGLKSIELEVWMGFVFVRFRPGGTSVAERFAPYEEEISHYRLAEMVAASEDWNEEHGVDWKNAVDNYCEDYHFPIGHEGLFALMEQDYDREVSDQGVLRLSHKMKSKPPRDWSGRHYHKLLPTYTHLPKDLQRRWNYFGLFPTVYFDLFPDSIDVFQIVPVAPGRLRLDSKSYILPNPSRETKASLYLSTRVNTRVQNEDNWLTTSVQGGLESSGYSKGILSDKEVAVKGFQDWLRKTLPLVWLDQPPTPGQMNRRNEELLAETRENVMPIAAE